MPLTPIMELIKKRKMKKTLLLKENIITVFVIAIILYYTVFVVNFRPTTLPIFLNTTQDSSCFTPQGWPIPCEEP